MALSDGLRVRDYVDSDDEACKQLELLASQFQAYRGLVKMTIIHHQAFDAKASLFPAKLVLVCVDDTCGGAVCGVVAVAIKRAYVHGSLRTVGYVFDLRVSEAYQRRGIGLGLSREVERRCAAPALGVEYLYLSVNADNKKAKALYTRLGWRPASPRRLKFTLLYSPKAPSAPEQAAASRAGGVRRIETVDEALAVIDGAYAGRDLALPREDLRRLLHSELYLGTFVCDDGAGSRAALSLWHGATFTSFRPVRVFLTAQSWRVAGPAALVGAGAALVLGLTRACLAAYDSDSGAAMLAAAALVSTCAWATVVAARFAAWCRSRDAFRARAFAAVGTGPAWQPLMAAVRARVAEEARALGFTMLLTNSDIADPVASYDPSAPADAARAATGAERLLPSGAASDALARMPSDSAGAPAPADAAALPGGASRKRAATEFWHKLLAPSTAADDDAGDAQATDPAAAETLRPLAPDNFFDPRDMS